MRLSGDEVLLLRLDQSRRILGHGGAERGERQEVVRQAAEDVPRS
jgi:hypothetical protein